MKLRIFSTLFFGVFAVFIGFLFFASWHTFQTEGTHFLRSTSGRSGFTTFDHMIGLGVVAALFGLCFLGCLAGLLSSSDTEESGPEQSVVAGDSESGPSWICPGCHEENPGNFEECWKCQRNRPFKRDS
jgi:hypothetical protein